GRSGGVPRTMRDIPSYGNGVCHVTSILQPATPTSAAVVGVALVTVTAVAGSATGATDLGTVESAVRFVIETAKDFGRGIAHFVDAEEVRRLNELYGGMSHLRGAAEPAAR